MEDARTFIFKRCQFFFPQAVHPKGKKRNARRNIEGTAVQISAQLCSSRVNSVFTSVIMWQVNQYRTLKFP